MLVKLVLRELCESLWTMRIPCSKSSESSPLHLGRSQAWATISCKPCGWHKRAACPTVVLLIVDAYSRWLEVEKVANLTSRTTIDVLHNYIAHFGMPETIVSDNGIAFSSVKFDEFTKYFVVHHKTTPQYHPASNGQVEKYADRVKRGLERMKKERNSLSLKKPWLDVFYSGKSYLATPEIRASCHPQERTVQCRTWLP